jgi:hypothetical protein
VLLVSPSLVQLATHSLAQLETRLLAQLVNMVVMGEPVRLDNPSLAQLGNRSLVRLVEASLVQLDNHSLVQLVVMVNVPTPVPQVRQGRPDNLSLDPLVYLETA